MNGVYHIEAPTYEEYERILNEMIEDGDPALCCATVEWRKVQDTESK